MSATLRNFNTAMVKTADLAGAGAATNIAVTNAAVGDIILQAQAYQRASVLLPLFRKDALVAGAGSATSIVVTGIVTADSIHRVLAFPGAGTAVTDILDLTSEASITSAGNIQISTTVTTGAKLLVEWEDASAVAQEEDLTSEASFTSAGQLQLASTSTTGRRVRLLWLDLSQAEA